MGMKKNSPGFKFPDLTVKSEDLTTNIICNKQKHASRENAENHMWVMVRLKKHKKKRGLLHTYFCTVCDAWHIGHSKWKNLENKDVKKQWRK